MFPIRFFPTRYFPGRYFTPSPDFVAPSTWETIPQKGEVDDPMFDDIAEPSGGWVTVTPPTDGWTEQ